MKVQIKIAARALLFPLELVLFHILYIFIVNDCHRFLYCQDITMLFLSIETLLCLGSSDILSFKGHNGVSGTVLDQAIHTFIVCFCYSDQ